MVLALAGCRFLVQDDLGSMVLVVSALMDVKTIAPDIDMTLAEYSVEGAGPNGAHFIQTFTPPHRSSRTAGAGSLVPGNNRKERHR